LFALCAKQDHAEDEEPYGFSLLWADLQIRFQSFKDLCYPHDNATDSEELIDGAPVIGKSLSQPVSTNQVNLSINAVSQDSVASELPSPAAHASSSQLLAQFEEQSHSNNSLVPSSSSVKERCHFGLKIACVSTLTSLFVLVPAIGTSLSTSLSGIVDPNSRVAAIDLADSSFTSLLKRVFEDNLSWIALSGVLVMEVSVGAAVRKGLLRIFGTIIGW
jgi:hypothetical protein